jgi:hypothetical protein
MGLRQDSCTSDAKVLADPGASSALELARSVGSHDIRVVRGLGCLLARAHLLTHLQRGGLVARRLGAHLLREAESRMRAAGAVRQQAIVVESESVARSFWQASGWQQQVERLRFVKG